MDYDFSNKILLIIFNFNIVKILINLKLKIKDVN